MTGDTFEGNPSFRLNTSLRAAALAFDIYRIRIRVAVLAPDIYRRCFRGQSAPPTKHSLRAAALALNNIYKTRVRKQSASRLNTSLRAALALTYTGYAFKNSSPSDRTSACVRRWPLINPGMLSRLRPPDTPSIELAYTPIRALSKPYSSLSDRSTCAAAPHYCSFRTPACTRRWPLT